MKATGRLRTDWILVFALCFLSVSIWISNAFAEQSYWDKQKQLLHGSLYNDLSTLKQQADAAQDPRERAIAQMILGMAYAMGEGVEQDYSQAVFWWRKSAEWNASYDPLFYLGRAYVTGEGVPVDYVEAYMWFNLASAIANNESDRTSSGDARNRLSSMMTKEQIAEAQRLSREWKSRTRQAIQGK